MQSEFRVQYGQLHPEAPGSTSTKVWQVINFIMAVFFILAACANVKNVYSNLTFLWENFRIL